MVQGKTDDAAQRLLDDALALEQAGCFSIVLESIPAMVASAITQQLRIPTIGIGAGTDCDGQVLVIYDILGMNPQFNPRFVKRYAELGVATRDAAAQFVQEVRDGAFPEAQHSFSSKKLTRAPAVQEPDSDADDAEILELYSAPV